MIDKEIIKQIGLSEAETEVYLIVLKLNESLAGQIAKQSNISRPHIYDSLNKLIKKGLISYVIKNNRKYFRPIEPIKLISYLKEKEESLKEKEESLKEILPDLQALYQPLRKKLKIEIYEGVEGLKTILNDIVKNKKDVVAFGASDRVRQYLPDFFIKRYLKEREKKRIIARQLFSESTGILETKVSIFRKLPREFASPSTTIIYGNKVTIWIWAKIPSIILIENKDLAKSYKDHFELMWKNAKI